jgi:hypothetical protein
MSAVGMMRAPNSRRNDVAVKADFTEDEWKALQKGITGAGMLVSLSDRDFTDSFGEVGALAKLLATQRESGASELVRELANVKGTGFGFRDSMTEVESETLDALRTSFDTLATKAPDEVENYRGLVLAVADAVGEAKGGVSDEEAAALDKIRAAVD